jgi:hypothetical protein
MSLNKTVLATAVVITFTAAIPGDMAAAQPPLPTYAAFAKMVQAAIAECPQKRASFEIFLRIAEKTVAHGDPNALVEARDVTTLQENLEECRKDTAGAAKYAADIAAIRARDKAEEPERQKRQAALEAQMRKPFPKIGMTAEEIRNDTRVGAPYEVHRTTTASGTREQWRWFRRLPLFQQRSSGSDPRMIRFFRDGCAIGWRIAAPLSAVVLAAVLMQRFDWDRYHECRDWCTEADRIGAACARGPWCDELALRQAQRACSPFSHRRAR